MEETVGAYIFDPDGMLLVTHPNESSRDVWGIPKGRPDEGEESWIQVAIREVDEETGINLMPYVNQMKFVGSEKYIQKSKILHAYIVYLPVHIPLRELHCKSLFFSRKSNQRIPEIDEYLWVDFDRFKFKMQPEQVNLLERYNFERSKG